MAARGFGFWMWRQTLAHVVLYLLSDRILCSNVRVLAGNLSDLTVASSQYDILLCSESFVSDMRHVSELLVPGFGRSVLLCRGAYLSVVKVGPVGETDAAVPNVPKCALQCAKLT